MIGFGDDDDDSSPKKRGRKKKQRRKLKSGGSTSTYGGVSNARRILEGSESDEEDYENRNPLTESGDDLDDLVNNSYDDDDNGIVDRSGRSKSRKKKTRPVRSSRSGSRSRTRQETDNDHAVDKQLKDIEKTVATSSKRLDNMLDKLRIRTTNMSEKTGKEIAREAREKEARKLNGGGKGKGGVPKIRKPPKGLFPESKSPSNEIKMSGKSIGL